MLVCFGLLFISSYNCYNDKNINNIIDPMLELSSISPSQRQENCVVLLEDITYVTCRTDHMTIQFFHSYTSIFSSNFIERKLKFRLVKTFYYSYTARKQWGETLNLGCLFSSYIFFYIDIYLFLHVHAFS